MGLFAVSRWPPAVIVVAVVLALSLIPDSQDMVSVHLSGQNNFGRSITYWTG